MLPSDTIFGVFLISLMCTGVTGNSLLFLLYVYTFSVKPHLMKHIDPIVMQLVFCNSLSITVTLIPEIVSKFGVRHFLNDVGCQTVLFSYRVTRGVSICSTSLLSAFQAVTISPSNSKWAWLKFKLSAWTCPLFLFFWILNMVVYFHVIQSVKAIDNITLIGTGYVDSYCQNKYFGKHGHSSLFIAMTIRDVVFVVLMICTSLYMVSLLYRHRRRAQHLHSPSVSSQSSPEHKATHTILLLVSCFVFFYISNNCLTVYYFYSHKKMSLQEEFSKALSSWYPTICPFVLMKNNRIFSQYFSSFSMMRISAFHRKSDGC